MDINRLVNTGGAYNLCINEVIQEQMRFVVIDKRKAKTADGRTVECDIVCSTCMAMVLPGDCEPFIRAAILNEMLLPFVKIKAKLLWEKA